MNEVNNPLTNDTKTTGKVLTGRRVFLYFAMFFGVMLAANLTLLFSALGSFPGLEVKNSYVASQVFNENARAQSALGWAPSIAYENGVIQIGFTDEAGAPVFPNNLVVVVGRPTHDRDDQNLELIANDKGYSSRTSDEPGSWRVYIDADADNGTHFSSRMEMYIPFD